MYDRLILNDCSTWNNKNDFPNKDFVLPEILTIFYNPLKLVKILFFTVEL